MGFGLDYNAISEYDTVPEGVYECIITNAGIKELPSGKEKIGFTLTIRNDVEQQCQNRTLFLDVWRKHEPNASDMAVDGFNFSQLMNIAKQAKIENGKKYEGLEDFLRELVGKLLRVKVTHTRSGENVYANINGFTGITRSKFPECRHTRKEPVQTETFAAKPSGLEDFVDLPTDDEIPF